MNRPGPDPLELTHVAAKTAVEAAARAELGKEALALLRPELTPRGFTEALLRGERYADAARFLAFALPRREAVWWGSLFVLWGGKGHLRAEGARALQAIVRWVIEPTEAHRLEAAEFDNPATPAGRLARAVKYTGGSLLPPTAPARPPGPMLTPRAVLGAISFVARVGNPKTLPLRQRQAVALGMHVARGHYLWPAPSTPPPVHSHRPTTGS